MNKKGFTLIELLAVIVVLAIILAIAIPSISSVISNSKVNAMESSVKLMLNSIKIKMLENTAFDPTTINETNVKTLLNINDDNYKTIKITMENGTPYVRVAGKNKWDSISIIGSSNNLKTYDGLVMWLDAADLKSYSGSGTAWYDLSGNGNDALLSSNITFSGNSLYFDGIDDYATVNNNLKTVIENANGFTIMALANVKYIEHVDNLFGWGNANDGKTFGIYAQFDILKAGYTGSNLGGSELLNKWLFLVARFGPGNATISNTFGSVNNSNTGSVNWKGISTTYPITIAKTSYFARFMEVDISSIQAYNRVLSDAELQSNFDLIRTRYGI